MHFLNGLFKLDLTGLAAIAPAFSYTAFGRVISTTPVELVIGIVLLPFALLELLPEAQGGSVTLIQRFGLAANLNIHLHCLVLDGVYRSKPNGE